MENHSGEFVRYVAATYGREVSVGGKNYPAKTGSTDFQVNFQRKDYITARVNFTWTIRGLPREMRKHRKQNGVITCRFLRHKLTPVKLRHGGGSYRSDVDEIR